MKARLENGIIKRYPLLPQYYKHWAGGFREQPEEVHRAEGFYNIVEPEYNRSTEKLGELFWDEQAQVFTFPVLTITYDLEELRQQRTAELESVLDEFAVLISRCQLTYGLNNEGLNAAIEETRQMQLQTITTIRSIDTVEAMLAFKIKPEDVE